MTIKEALEALVGKLRRGDPLRAACEHRLKEMAAGQPLRHTRGRARVQHRFWEAERNYRKKLGINL